MKGTCQRWPWKLRFDAGKDSLHQDLHLSDQHGPKKLYKDGRLCEMCAARRSFRLSTVDIIRLEVQLNF